MPTRRMRSVHAVVSPLILGRLRASVDGVDLVPGAGPAILASNHISYLDNYVIMSAAPRPLHFLGKAELASGPMGRLNTSLGMVPIDRGSRDAGALEALIALLGRGELVALFPEGTRSPTGELHRFRSGMARIAAAAGAPVVPVAVVGTDVVWPRGEQPRLRAPSRGVVGVRFGAPLPPPADDPRQRRAFTAQVREAVAELSGQTTVRRYAPVVAEERVAEPPEAAAPSHEAPRGPAARP